MQITPVDSTTPKMVYSDVNLGLNLDSQYDVVYDEESIQSSVTMILGTRKGSRVFRRDFGSVLETYLWDPMDNITVSSIRTEIIGSISKWETRIVLTDVVVRPDYDNQQYYVQLAYTIPGLGNRSAVFTFNLQKS
jgi:uncharacterized protein